MTGVRKVFYSNFAWLFTDKFIRIIGGLVVGIWIARFLGPLNFGILNFAVAFVTMFSFIANLGLDRIVVKDLALNPNDYNVIIGTAFKMKLCGSFFAFLSISIIIPFVSNDNLLFIPLVYIFSLIYFIQSMDVIDFYFQSKILSKYVVYARSSAYIVANIVNIYLILNNFSVHYFVASMVLESFIAMLLMIYIYIIRVNKLQTWEFNKSKAKELFINSLPLMFNTLLISIHLKIDQVMIHYFLNDTDVGIYSVAVTLSTSWYIIPQLIVNTVFPYLTRLKSNDPDLYHNQLSSLYCGMFWLGVISSIITIVIGRPAIKLLYGTPYVNAYYALVINIWCGIFIAQAFARGIWIISENLQKFRLYNNILAVIINIALNVLLIQRLGIAGAALSTLVTQFSSTWIFPLFWKPLRESTWVMIKSINPIFVIKLKAFNS